MADAESEELEQLESVSKQAQQPDALSQVACSNAGLAIAQCHYIGDRITTVPPLSWVIKYHGVPRARDTLSRYTANPPLRWCVQLFGPPRPGDTLDTDWKPVIEAEDVRGVECEDGRVDWHAVGIAPSTPRRSLRF